MTVVDAAWLAGLLEGEGSFILRRRGLPRLAIDMTDRDVIERAACLLGGARVCERKPNGTTHHRPVYFLRVGCRQAVQWMMTIYSLMGVRRRAQIRVCLDRWKEGKRVGGWAARRARTGPIREHYKQRCSLGRIHPLSAIGCISRKHSAERHPLEEWRK